MGDFDRMIRHFSHQHPLELTKPRQENLISSSFCSGCKLGASKGWVYSCKSCSFTLHITCSTLPRKITHPSHGHHPLILFPSPVYPEGVFACDGCGRLGSGFCYHCKECEVDIDIICASMKLSVNHDAHCHPLTLVFSPPYATKDFVCDSCKKPGSNHWLYHCSACEFDVHTTCAGSRRSQSETQKSAIAETKDGLKATGRTDSDSSVASPQVPPFQKNLQQLLSPNIATPTRIHRTGSTNLQPRVNLMNILLQGWVEGSGQALGQALLQAVMGEGREKDPSTLFSRSESVDIGPCFLSSDVGGGIDPSALSGIFGSLVNSSAVGLN